MNRSGPAGQEATPWGGRRPAHTHGGGGGKAVAIGGRWEEKWGEVCSVESSPERTGRPAGKRAQAVSA